MRDTCFGREHKLDLLCMMAHPQSSNLYQMDPQLPTQPEPKFHLSLALRRGHELIVPGVLTNSDYAPISLRRNTPAMPTSPVPRRPKVPGSGTVVILPTRMCPIPLVHWALVL